jgi:hypothetical protein
VVRADAITVDFQKAFNLVSHNMFITKIAEKGVDLGIVVWVEGFILGSYREI